MIDVAKYMNGEYVKGEHDCWTLMQDIFMDVHGISLPDFPIVGFEEKDYADCMVSNMRARKIKEPKQGCIVHRSGIIEHVGYCLDGKHYIHRTKEETRCDRIKGTKCAFYEVLA